MARARSDRVKARLKSILKQTPAYGWLKASRARRRLAEWTPHDRRMLEFYSSLVSPGDLCFDVGANIGNRVKIFLELGARVVAVEPQRECARVLETAFGRHPRFTLVEQALGETEGEAEMLLSDADPISSLSREWIAAVSESGRFSGRRWDRRRVVSMTTLDQLVARHGVPAFAKIDVEGFEASVVQGLSTPLKALSLEFTPEFLESTFRCFDHLEKVGDIRLNLSFEESMRWALDAWVDRREMVAVLSELRGDTDLWGDVYVRFAALLPATR
jgi:FkbM family methyltransferase